MFKMSLSMKLISSFAVIILLFVINSSICVYNNRVIHSTFQKVTDQSFPELITLDNIKTNFFRMGLEAINVALINEKHTEFYVNIVTDKVGLDEEVEQFTLATQQLEKSFSDYDESSLLPKERILAVKLRELIQQYKERCLALIEATGDLHLLEERRQLEEIEEQFVATVDSAIFLSHGHVKNDSLIGYDKINNASLLSLAVTLVVVVSIILFAILFYKTAMKLQFTTRTLAEKNDALIRVNQEKNDFIGIVVHDLKNPLSAILGMAEIIKEDVGSISDEELTEYTQLIEQSAKDMFQLIINLLDISAIESGRMKMLLEPTDILPIVQNLIKDYTRRAQAKNITLHFEAKTDSCVAKIDKNTMRQILDNLISNAIKYSPKGKDIYIQLGEENHKLRCTVRDEGVGLSQEDQRKLFNKFARLTPKPTDGESSNGLGLFIVKKFIEAMNGKVWCESEVGKGCRFIIEFFCIDNLPEMGT